MKLSTENFYLRFLVQPDRKKTKEGNRGEQFSSEIFTPLNDVLQCKRKEELKRNLGKKAGQGHAPEVQKW